MLDVPARALARNQPRTKTKLMTEQTNANSATGQDGQSGSARTDAPAYRKPKLRVYGDVSELTASGNGQTSPTGDPTAPAFCGNFPNYPGCRTS